MNTHLGLEDKLYSVFEYSVEINNVTSIRKQIHKHLLLCVIILKRNDI